MAETHEEYLAECRSLLYEALNHACFMSFGGSQLPLEKRIATVLAYARTLIDLYEREEDVEDDALRMRMARYFVNLCVDHP